MNFVTDESVDQAIVQRLRHEGHQVWYIAEMEPGVSDDTVLNLANREAALEAVGLGDLVTKNYMEISGGERQLVLIARAIAQDASFFLFDEPTSHLDFNNQHRVLGIIKDLCRSKGYGVIASMHDPNLVASFADRVVFLKAGRIAAAGEASDIMTDEGLGQLYDMDLKVLDLEDVNWEQVQDVVREAFRTVAPSRLAALV